jgi:hypothetical protein
MVDDRSNTDGTDDDDSGSKNGPIPSGDIQRPAGDDTTESPDNTVQPPDKKASRKSPLLDQVAMFASSAKLESSGLLVFTITSISIIVMLALFTLIGTEPFVTLKTAEILLTLAGTALVVAFISRAQNPLVLGVGILLIGALIVPSTDIVRFAIIVSGSDKRIQDFFVSTRTGKSQRNRDVDVARQITIQLKQDGLIQVSGEQEVRTVDVIARELGRDRRLELLDQIEKRGSLRILREIQADNNREWIYKYGNDEKFKDDLSYLRTEGVISYVYEDYDTIQLTSLGNDVLNLEGDVVNMESGGTSFFPFGFGDSSPESPSLGATALLTDSCPPEEGGDPEVIKIEISADGQKSVLQSVTPTWLYFVVDEESSDVAGDDTETVVQSTEYKPFDIAVNADPGVDPKIYLFRARDDGSCELIGQDDDSGGGFNSRLQISLRKSKYYIAIRNLRNEGNITTYVRMF